MMTLEEPPLLSDEKQTILGFLAYQQQVFFNKLVHADGSVLSDRDLNCRVKPSSLTLKSLIAHLWWVEDYWREERVQGRDKMPQWSHLDFTQDADAEFHWALEQDTESLVTGLLESCKKTHELLSTRNWDDKILAAEGEIVNIRWVAVHLVEEWARHLGHADFLREAIDGSVGDERQ